MLGNKQLCIGYQSVKMGNRRPSAVFHYAWRFYQPALYSITNCFIPLSNPVDAVLIFKFYAPELLETPFKRWNLIPFGLNLISHKQNVAKMTA